MAHDEPRVIDGIDPDESPTPLWFTVLGILLFVTAGLVVLARSGDEAAEEQAPAQAADAAPEAPTEPAAAPPLH